MSQQSHSIESVADPIIGQFYLVTTARFEPILKRIQWWGDGVRIPLIGDLHHDKEIINFPDKHWHVDWRFFQHVAAYECRVAQVADWQSLPAAALRVVLAHVNQRANEKDPNVVPRPKKITAADVVHYQMKPARKFVPKPKKETVDCPF